MQDAPSLEQIDSASNHQYLRVSPSPLSRSPSPRLTSSFFYVADRAHHADIGGANAWLDEVGNGHLSAKDLRIPPIRIVRGGAVDADTMRLLLANVRGHTERRGDFDAPNRLTQNWHDAFARDCRDDEVEGDTRVRRPTHQLFSAIDASTQLRTFLMASTKAEDELMTMALAEALVPIVVRITGAW